MGTIEEIDVEIMKEYFLSQDFLSPEGKTQFEDLIKRTLDAFSPDDRRSFIQKIVSSFSPEEMERIRQHTGVREND
jgi:hypothetical protein